MADHNDKQKTLLVSTPGMVREATVIMLESIPQVGHVELVSGSLSAIEKLQNSNSYLLVIDANLPVEEAASLVRWSLKHRPDTRCVVLVSGAGDLDQIRAAGADAVFLRSKSARQLAQTLWPEEQQK